MTKKKKIILSIICILLFIVSTIIIVFYSQGLRFDFEKRKITQTGAFYFKVLPSNARVYINDKFIKRTDFYVDSAYVGNLLFRKYNISIRKDGYLNWEKTLEMKEEGLVTEVKNIVLIKESPNFTSLFEKIEKFFFLSDETKLILLEKHDSLPSESNDLIKNNSWELKIYDLRTNTKSHLLKSSDISKQKISFIDLKISPDSNRALLITFIDEKENFSYHLIDLSKIPVTITPLNLREKNISNISFHPKDTQKILFLQENILSQKTSSSSDSFINNQLFQYDFIKKEESSTSLENIITYTLNGLNIYFLNEEGYVLKTDSSYKEKEKINKTAFPIKNNINYKIIVLNEFIFIKEKDDLYLIDLENKSFERFFEKNKDIKISPNNQKAVYFSNSEISILFLKEEEGQPYKNYREKTFLARFSETINDVFWLTSHYLIFNTENKIKVSEIDDRDKINIFNLNEFEKPEIYFNQYNKKLYILTENNFIESEPLI